MSKGQWSEDPKYKFIVAVEIAEIFEIKRFLFGYNSITVIYQDGHKITESTWPRYHFKKIVKATIEDAMVDILKHHTAPTNIDISQRLYEMNKYITKYYPEKLI